MRILLATVGSRGDVEPYVALARGLAGHEVTVATHEPFRTFVEDHGAGFAPLPGDPRQVLHTEQARELLSTGPSVVRFARRFLGVLEPWFQDLAAATEPLVRRADVAAYSPLAFTVWHQAQAHGVATALAALQPFARTRAFSTVPGGGADRGRWLNLASHVVTEQLFWQPLRRPVNRWRADALGLAPLPLAGPHRQLAGEPQLYGFSPSLVPPPPDWPDTVRVTGAWRLADPAPVDPDLVDFFDSGPAPVYVGFGSMVDRDATRMSEIVVAAARQAGVRLVLGAGWTGLAGDAGDDVLVVGETPHHLVFPRTAAVVHHGGAGTTHTAAAAGVPQVVVPFFADQPFWGRRVEQAGIGPPQIPRAALTPEALSSAIRRAVSGATVERARRLGQRIRAEDGVGTAARILESL
jgi:sterol 3beta-glucosyltransferase